MFRNTSLVILVLCALAACTPGGVRSGDLLFVALPMDYRLDSTSMDSGIAAATGVKGELNYIHAAILEVEGDSVWVIDATIAHGVDRHPIDTFFHDFTLRDGSLPVLEVMRFKDGPRDIVARAKSFLGQPYDVHFLPDNGAKYCTELIRDSYLDSDGKPLLGSVPMNFKNAEGEFPPYWVELFALLGESVPQGVEGTNPQDMHGSPLLKRTRVTLTKN